MECYIVQRSKNDAQVQTIKGEERAMVEEVRGKEIDPRIWPNGGFAVASEDEARRCTCSKDNQWKYEGPYDHTEVPLKQKKNGKPQRLDESDVHGGGAPAKEVGERIEDPTAEGDEISVGLEDNRRIRENSDDSEPAPELSEMNKGDLKRLVKNIRKSGGPDIDLRTADRSDMEQYCREYWEKTLG